jgi:hypothetical protein
MHATPECRPRAGFIEQPMRQAEDRLAEIKEALNAYEQAKNAYHDALRNADRTLLIRSPSPGRPHRSSATRYDAAPGQ